MITWGLPWGGGDQSAVHGELEDVKQLAALLGSAVFWRVAPSWGGFQGKPKGNHLFFWGVGPPAPF